VAPVRSIAELPFVPRPVMALLHLDEPRPAPDVGYAGYGHARAASVVLERRASPAVRRLRDVLLIAVHAADEPEALGHDLELGFELGDGDGVSVLASDFLRVWLPRLRGDEQAIVLVACNPHRARLPRPAAAGDTPLYFAIGDVDSWCAAADEPGTVRLMADDWHLAEPCAHPEEPR
jgi:hypothetical protein